MTRSSELIWPESPNGSSYLPRTISPTRHKWNSPARSTVNPTASFATHTRDEPILRSSSKGRQPIHGSRMNKGVTSSSQALLIKSDSYRSVAAENGTRAQRRAFSQQRYQGPSKTFLCDSHIEEPNLDENLPTSRLILHALHQHSRLNHISTAQHDQTSSPFITTSTSESNMRLDRQSSSQSNRSRDPNDSYAYTDVKKYIEENDLMPPEKEHEIRLWVADVIRCRSDSKQTE
jgi:hypothetical protein